MEIVIASANEDDIRHNTFYTAITRALQRLCMYWSPETLQAVINWLHTTDIRNDVALLSARRACARPAQAPGVATGRRGGRRHRRLTASRAVHLGGRLGLGSG